jgi:hypothetical protein
MSSLFLPAVLVRDVPQVGGDPADPLPPTQATYPCKAIVEGYSDYFKANNLVNASDRKVLILATSIGAKPAAGDRVTISGITFTLQDVSTDPAEAVWTCRGSM